MEQEEGEEEEIPLEKIEVPFRPTEEMFLQEFDNLTFQINHEKANLWILSLHFPFLARMKKFMLDTLLESKQLATEDEEYKEFVKDITLSDKNNLEVYLKEGYDENNRPDLIYLNTY